MAEDGKYDPDAGVAPWINIVVPIMTIAIFDAVLAIVSLTPYEIDIKTLDIWAEKIIFIKRKMVPETQEKHENSQEHDKVSSKVPSEKSSIRKCQPANYGSTEAVMGADSNV